MNRSIYTETLCRLMAAADNYRAKNINLESYQSEIFKAENEIVSIEERELRSLLLNHENELELIQFTTGDQRSIYVEVDKFQEALRLWM
jgi:hypothetical protein